LSRLRKAQRLLLPRRRKRRKSLMPPRPSWPKEKPLLSRRGRTGHRDGKQIARNLEKAPNLKKLVLQESRQKTRQLSPGSTIFNKELSSFRSLPRKYKNWSGSGNWTKRITSIL